MTFLIMELSCKSTPWIEEQQENIIQDGCIPEKIRTFRRLNTSLDLYRYNKQ